MTLVTLVTLVQHQIYYETLVPPQLPWWDCLGALFLLPFGILVDVPFK